MAETIKNAQARGTIESQVPPLDFQAEASHLTAAVSAAIEANVSSDMLMAYGMLGATRKDLVKHIATRALQEWLALP